MDLTISNWWQTSSKTPEKLVHGRIDLWAYKIPGLKTVCELAGVDFDEVEEIYSLREIDVSIAFSIKTSDTIVKAWQNALRPNDGRRNVIEDSEKDGAQSRTTPLQIIRRSLPPDHRLSIIFWANTAIEKRFPRRLEPV